MSAAAAPPPERRPRPLVLCIVDGLGEREGGDANAVALARTPTLAALAASAQKTVLGASGEDVGLPPGQAGHGEVGHVNLGAGRIARTSRSRIDAVIAANKLGTNEVVERVFRIAMDWKCRVHLFGLVSDGRVHASLEHFVALFQLARFHEIPVVVHAFLDGRDSPPKSALDHLQRLEVALEGAGVIGTLSGRSYAMDRDGRWDRVMKAYTAIVRGDAPRAETVFEAIQRSYAEDRADEIVEPIRIGEYEGVKGSFMADFAAKEPVWEWYGEEVGLAVNFRPDRLRELSAMFVRRNVPPEVEELLTDRKKPVIAFQDWCYNTMTEVDPALKLPVAFPREEIPGSFGEAISRAGLTQLRCAETEKSAHVTTFFSGGREEPFPGEDRRLVPSPRDVPTYDRKPETSAPEVAAEVASAIRAGQHDFILVNLASADLVGHTGALDATVQAVEAADAALGAIVAAVREAGGALIVTAAHGNCEQMKDDHGKPHTAHTANPVPLYYLNESDPVALRPGGRLSDVAPTMLEILGLPQPEAMTGRSLRVPR
jgi:2,3-bisphosphoglycerate-independent phosphoglycerate mutase